MTEPVTLNDLLDKWHNTAKLAAQYSLQESELRRQIFDMAVPLLPADKPLKRGVNKIKIDHGMALLLDHRLNYKIDRPAMEATLTGSEDNERAVIESIISYSPKVKDAAFEALTGDDLKLVTPFITVTPGLPGIEIKPQNKVRW